MLLVRAAGAQNGGQTISLTANDYSFAPNSWTVKAGERATLRMMNESNNEHEWVLLKAGEQVTMPFDEDDAARIALWFNFARTGWIQRFPQQFGSRRVCVLLGRHPHRHSPVDAAPHHTNDAGARQRIEQIHQSGTSRLRGAFFVRQPHVELGYRFAWCYNFCRNPQEVL